MGGGLGLLWAAAGHEVMFSDCPGVDKPRELAELAGTGVCAGTTAEAAQFAEVVLFAPPWSAYRDALTSCGPLGGKTLIDVINPLTPDLSGMDICPASSASEEIAKLAPGARVVKAYNTLPAGLLHSGKELLGGDVPSVFFCGDNPEAKRIVEQLIRDSGFDPVDAGALTSSRYLEPMGLLLIKVVFAMPQPKDVALRLLRPV